jgi:protein CpxP
MMMRQTNKVPRFNLIALAVALTLGGVATVTLAKPPGFGPDGPMSGPDRVESRLERMSEHLDLTPAQREEIRAILEAQAETARRDRAAVRAEIERVLTDEQRALRDTQRQARMERRLDRMADRLDLTEAQRGEVRSILLEQAADPALSRVELRERVAAVLTDEQREQMSRMRGRRDGGPGGGER